MSELPVRWYRTTRGMNRATCTSGVEAMARRVLGASVRALAVVGPKELRAYLGIIPLEQVLACWCPPSELFGISTCRQRK